MDGERRELERPARKRDGYAVSESIRACLASADYREGARAWKCVHPDFEEPDGLARQGARPGSRDGARANPQDSSPIRPDAGAIAASSSGS